MENSVSVNETAVMNSVFDGKLYQTKRSGYPCGRILQQD